MAFSCGSLSLMEPHKPLCGSHVVPMKSRCLTRWNRVTTWNHIHYACRAFFQIRKFRFLPSVHFRDSS